MAEASDSLNDVDKLYEYGGRLNEATDKSQVSSQLHRVFLLYISRVLINI